MNNVELKIKLFISYYGDWLCNKFVPFGYNGDIMGGNKTTLVKNLTYIDKFGTITLYNKHNNQEFIYADKNVGTVRIWCDNGEGKKFDIDYWLDKVVDKI